MLAPLSAVVVTTEGELNSAIITANGGDGPNIDFGSDITHTIFFRPLNSTSTFTPIPSNSYIIDRVSAHTLSGSPHAFFSHGGGGGASHVTVQNLTVSCSVTGGVVRDAA